MDYNSIFAHVSMVNCNLDDRDIKEIQSDNQRLMELISNMTFDGEEQPLYNDKIATIDF